MMPDTGGQYVYLREAYGDWCAFLCGWVFALAAVPGGIAFLAVGFAIYLDHFTPLSAAMRTVVALALVCGLSLINAIGVREGVWVQRIFTSLKIAGLLLVIGSAVFAPAAGSGRIADSPPLTYAGVGIAMVACLMAYNGWSYVSFVAGEVKRPERNLPAALALGMGVVMALYVSANLAYLHVMTIPEIAATERVGAAVAQRVMGPSGAAALSMVVLLSIVGAINGCILTGARIPFAQARDGLFFASFGKIHPKFETPAFAIAMRALWTCLLIVTGSYASLSSYTIISAWIFYTMSVAAVWVLRRKKPDVPRPYRMLGYPINSLAVHCGFHLVPGRRAGEPAAGIADRAGASRRRNPRVLTVAPLGQIGHLSPETSPRENSASAFRSISIPSPGFSGIPSIPSASSLHPPPAR